MRPPGGGTVPAASRGKSGAPLTANRAPGESWEHEGRRRDAGTEAMR